MEKEQVLLVEDNKQLTDTIKTLLKDFNVITAESAEEAYEIINKKQIVLYVLDLMLADRDGQTGLDICKFIRQTSHEPIIIITAKRAINYKLGAFNLGADDYLCKPFNFLELRARVKALLKRTNNQALGSYIKYKNIFIDKEHYIAKFNDKAVPLSKKEVEILQALVEHNGKTLTRDVLIRRLWPYHKDVGYNTIDVHIKKIRDKLEKPFNIKLIKTVHGIGYKIE